MKLFFTIMYHNFRNSTSFLQ